MRSVLLRGSNYLLYLSTCFLISTGLVLQYRLGHGSPRLGLTILGYDRHFWGALHLYGACLFVALTTYHLWLHWGWIKKVASGSSGALLFISILPGLLLVALVLIAPIVKL